MNPLDANSVPPVPAAPVKAPRYTAQQWDQVRGAFCSSILADTSLNSLAQNLEGQAWPLTGPSEVPSAYLDLSWSELRESLALRGQPPAVADLLLSILEETLAFDAPFGDMLAPSKTASVEENPVVKNLAKLKIDSAFPVGLTALSADTLVFCQLENLKTVGELALAAQRMAGAVIVGGDFRALLNALSNIDEAEIARLTELTEAAGRIDVTENLGQDVLELRCVVSREALFLSRDPNEVFHASLNRAMGEFRAYVEEQRRKADARLAAAKAFSEARSTR
jgi:hypothetical protein